MYGSVGKFGIDQLDQATDDEKTRGHLHKICLECKR